MRKPCRSTEELVKVSWTEITHPDDLPEDLRQFELFRSGEIKGYTMESYQRRHLYAVDLAIDPNRQRDRARI
mgnify:CR=1 FL=1